MTRGSDVCTYFRLRERRVLDQSRDLHWVSSSFYCCCSSSASVFSSLLTVFCLYCPSTSTSTSISILSISLLGISLSLLHLRRDYARAGIRTTGDCAYSPAKPPHPLRPISNLTSPPPYPTPILPSSSRLFCPPFAIHSLHRICIRIPLSPSLQLPSPFTAPTMHLNLKSLTPLLLLLAAASPPSLVAATDLAPRGLPAKYRPEDLPLRRKTTDDAAETVKIGRAHV